MVVSPAGTLLVASAGTDSVIEYNLASGALLRTLVATGAGGLTEPSGLALGPDGLLYVSTGDNAVLRYNVTTGAFVSPFVTPGSGSLSGARGLLFLPSGTLLVASNTNDRVNAYSPTGGFVESWAKTAVAFQGPWGLRTARNGNVLVSARGVTDTHVTRARIHEFDVDNGYWVRGYVLGSDTGLTGTCGFDLVPDAGTDCNDNQRPDNCDIAAGYSLDLNGNGVPDECEHFCYADCNGDGTLNLTDFGCFQTKFSLGLAYADCNGDGVRNLSDFGCFQTKFALGCP
jgi:DNA-binding beta-propeller fold protein YncE